MSHKCVPMWAHMCTPTRTSVCVRRPGEKPIQTNLFTFATILVDTRMLWRNILSVLLLKGMEWKIMYQGPNMHTLSNHIFYGFRNLYIISSTTRHQPEYPAFHWPKFTGFPDIRLACTFLRRKLFDLSSVHRIHNTFIFTLHLDFLFFKELIWRNLPLNYGFIPYFWINVKVDISNISTDNFCLFSVSWLFNFIFFFIYFY